MRAEKVVKILACLALGGAVVGALYVEGVFNQPSQAPFTHRVVVTWYFEDHPSQEICLVPDLSFTITGRGPDQKGTWKHIPPDKIELTMKAPPPSAEPGKAVTRLMDALVLEGDNLSGKLDGEPLKLRRPRR